MIYLCLLQKESWKHVGIRLTILIRKIIVLMGIDFLAKWRNRCDEEAKFVVVQCRHSSSRGAWHRSMPQWWCHWYKGKKLTSKNSALWMSSKACCGSNCRSRKISCRLRANLLNRLRRFISILPSLSRGSPMLSLTFKFWGFKFVTL